MLAVLEGAIGVLGVVLHVIATVGDFLLWRDDWNRRWSPISYCLAAISALVLVALVWSYGSAAWDLLKATLS
jgi:hypothetical protein